MRIDSLRKVKEVKGVGLEKAFEFFKGGLEIKADHFQSRWDVYDSLRTAHGIQMISHREYGDSLMDRLMAWQDTLVAQGSTISQCNQALKASGLDSRSDEYRSRYQPISQMQLIHKQFQAKLLQVENQQSRYASARQDEVFYLGPYLVERHDVMASERFFDELREFQGEFNALLREFRILNS